MWFIQIYLSLLPLGIVVLSLPQKQTCIVALFVVFSAFVVMERYYPVAPSFLFSNLRSVTCYLSLFLAGAAFKILKERISPGNVLSVWLLLGIVTFLACYQTHSFPDLQTIKFPPTALHLLFSMHSVMIVCLLIVLEDKNRLPPFPRRPLAFVSWCGKNTYRIYLWQGFATSIPYLFIPKLLKAGLPVPAIYCAALGWNIFVSAALAFCHNSLETVLAELKKKLRSMTENHGDA